MCIICNCGDTGDEFLSEFARAQASMKSATARMLECSKVAATPLQRKGYDAAHKKMVRLSAEWNQIEQEREHARTSPPNHDRLAHLGSPVNETQRSLFTAAIIAMLARAGGELRLTEAEYNAAKNCPGVTAKLDGRDMVFSIAANPEQQR